MKRGPQRRLSRPGKCDFRHPKAKSACFDISFFKLNIFPFAESMKDNSVFFLLAPGRGG